MRKVLQIAAAAFLAGAFWASPAMAQDPVTTGIAAAGAVPMVIKAIKPAKVSKWGKFEGTVLHANAAQITARARENDLAIETFALSDAAAAKMQKIIDKGGYQYGDKVTILFDPQTRKAVQIKGKPSRPV